MIQARYDTWNCESGYETEALDMEMVHRELYYDTGSKNARMIHETVNVVMIQEL
jgi:hypothetical protein